jgi:hypothetical protein
MTYELANHPKSCVLRFCNFDGGWKRGAGGEQLRWAFWPAASNSAWRSGRRRALQKELWRSARAAAGDCGDWRAISPPCSSPPPYRDILLAGAYFRTRVRHPPPQCRQHHLLHLVLHHLTPPAVLYGSIRHLLPAPLSVPCRGAPAAGLQLSLPRTAEIQPAATRSCRRRAPVNRDEVMSPPSSPRAQSSCRWLLAPVAAVLLVCNLSCHPSRLQLLLLYSSFPSRNKILLPLVNEP